MKTRIEALRRLQWWLDEAFRVPGTSIRVGWDPIIGLVPWAGDLFTALLSCAIVFQAHQMRLPRVVQLRMLMNVAIDLLIGAIPGVGDAADVFWKSNSMNMALLDRHAAEVRPTTVADWLFVAGILTAIVVVALVPLVVLYWLLTVLRHAF
jgi:multisubunit Na+/H+ antiporter MnhC subunit